MTYPETLSPQERKRYRLYAYAATWCGCFAEVMMESSAILILFMTLLGSSSTMKMLSTSMNGIVSMLLMFFAAGLADRFGAKKAISLAVCIEFSSCLLIASAPFWGAQSATFVVLAGCFIFCISRPIWTASWYVVMGDILLPSERGSFLGFMRFSYYTITGVTFGLIGLYMGEQAPIWLPQSVIALTGILAIGRSYFINKIKLAPHQAQNFQIRKALSVSLKNGRLVGFSIYVFMMYLAFAPVLPLATIYLKDQLHYGDNVVQTLATAGIGGSVCGFLLYGIILKLVGMRVLQILTHVLYISIPLLLAVCGAKTPGLILCLGVLIFLGSFAVACFGCIVSQETLALSKPGNVAMSTAFCQTYVMIGTAAGRLGMSVILGSGLLSLTWTRWGVSFCHFQSLFFLCAAIALFGLVLMPSLPSLVPENDNWYKPK